MNIGTSNITVTPTAQGRATIEINSPDQSQSVQIQGVKTYGKFLGRIFKFFGYANSLTTTDNKTYYVHLNSLLKHTTETFLDKNYPSFSKLPPDDKMKNIFKPTVENIRQNNPDIQKPLNGERIYQVYAEMDAYLPWDVRSPSKESKPLY